MAIFNNFPWTNMHGMNLDYFLAKLGELKKAVLDAQKAQELAEVAEDGAQAAEQGAKDYADAAAQSADAAADSAEAAQATADSIDPEAITADAKDYTDTKFEEAENYTDNKLNAISDFKLTAEMLQVGSFRPASYTSPTGSHIQGTCKAGKYLFGADKNNDRILKYDIETGTTTTAYTFTTGRFGHMNDFCYDGSSIVIAPGGGSDGISGKLFKLDVNEATGDIGLGTEINVPNNLNIWNIAYDPETDLYYTVTYVNADADLVSFSLDNNTFNIVNTIYNTHMYDHWPDSPRQGIEVYDGSIYCLSSDGDLPGLTTTVSVFDLEGNYVNMFETPMILGEAEALVYDHENNLMLMVANIWGTTSAYPIEAKIFVLDYKSKYDRAEVTGLKNPYPYSLEDPYAIKMLNASRYTGFADPDTIVRAARLWFGTNLKIKLQPVGHFLVLVNQTSMYLGWFAGTPVEVNLTKIAGTDNITLTTVLTDDELSITASTQCAITVLYFNGYRN